MFDVVALGELLIDFTAAGRAPDGARLFAQNPGGAPANLLCALANLGAATAFIGKVGADMHGDFLARTLAGHGVNTDGLLRDPLCFTTLAFVELGDAGERRFSFARGSGAADIALQPSELPSALLENTKIFHFGSLSLTHQPARDATLRAVQAAKRVGAKISYDPNYRAPLWPHGSDAAAQMRRGAALADWVKISLEEAPLLTDETAPERAAGALLAGGAELAAVTLGADGAYVATRSTTVRLPAFPVDAVDTTGAGDAFWGAFLFCILRAGSVPAQFTARQLEDAARFANAAASLCVQKSGGIPAMPKQSDIQARLAE